MAIALGIAIGRAYCATPVTSCADDGSLGTLRTILSGSANDAVIDLSGCSTITLTRGEILLPVSVTLQGAANGTTTVDANHGGRAFHSTSPSPLDKLQLQALTVTGGEVLTDNTAADGGCVLGGEVTLQDSVVTGCDASSDHAEAQGGAISANTVVLRNGRVEQGGARAQFGQALGGGIFASSGFKCYGSSISANAATSSTQISRGGGVAVSFGSALLSGCTVDSNYSRYAGGLMQSGALDDVVIVSNSTISSNFAAVADGGAFVSGVLSMQNSTVAYNFAVANCGGVQGASDIVIESNIIADNYSGNAGCIDLRSNGTISGSHNLVSVATTGLPADTIIANALLTPLADHGGPTRTHGLSLNSPAVDHGSNVGGLATDQRGAGFSRVVGASADIGAFERQADDDELFYGR
jgi:hypothetical protein